MRRLERYSLFPVLSLALAISGCGAGGGGGTGSTETAYTSVVVLASSRANDQLNQFPVTLKSLTLTSQSGVTTTLFSEPLSAEYIHLNGTLQPLVTVSLPQGVYTSATAEFDGAQPVCIGASLIDGAMTSGNTPTVTVNLPSPITVTGTAMGLVLNLQVSQSAPFSGGCVKNLSVPVSPVFNLTPLTIAAQPTNSANGKALGLAGVVASADAAGAGFTVTAAGGYLNSNPPTWQVSSNSSTVFDGVSSAAALSAGMPVDMDIALQQDGSLLATRVAVWDTDTTNLSLSIGQVESPGGAPSTENGLDAQVVGGLPGLSDEFGYANATSQISDQFTNVQDLPFSATFDLAHAAAGQNVLIVSNASPINVNGNPPIPLPADTATLVPQTIDGTVSAISTSGEFTTYTVTLASYDLFPTLAEWGGQTTILTNPGSVVVYADSDTQMLNSSSIGVGGVFRFYGLVFNDNGTLAMDCAQISDGVPE